VNWVHPSQNNLKLRAVVNKVIYLSRPVCRPAAAAVLLGFLFEPDNCGSKFLRNVSIFLPD
jgi:hypothetical protein